MNPAKWSRLGHRWLALLVGLQMVLWTASGFYMVAVSLDFIHGDSLVRNLKPSFDLQRARIPLASLVAGHPGQFHSARLHSLPDGVLVYELAGVGSLRVFDAATGRPLSPPSRARVIELARSYYAGSGTPARANLITNESDRPMEIGDRKLPLWRVDFDDWLETSFYIHPDTGALTVRRHRFWRWFDFLWSLHIMDYRERTDVNNWLLRVATVSGVALAGFGAWVAFFSFPFLQRLRQGQLRR